MSKHHYLCDSSYCVTEFERTHVHTRVTSWKKLNGLPIIEYKFADLSSQIGNSFSGSPSQTSFLRYSEIGFIVIDVARMRVSKHQDNVTIERSWIVDLDTIEYSIVKTDEMINNNNK